MTVIKNNKLTDSKDQINPLTWATKPSASAYGEGQAWFSDIRATGYSDGVSWTLPSFENLITHKGIILSEFLNGFSDAFSGSNTANVVTVSSTEFGGRGIKQYPLSTGTGAAVAGSIVFNCTPFMLRTDTRIVCLWYVVNPDAILSSVFCSTQASNFTNNCSGAGTQINTAIKPVEEGGSYIITEVTGAGLSTIVGSGIGVGSLIDRIKLFSTQSEGSSVTLLGVYLNPSCKPTCHLTFDDVAISSYKEGFAYCARKGIKGTMAINTANVGLDSSTYTLANMQEMYARGWDIVNHTHSHYYVNKPLDQTTTNSICQSQTPGSAGTFLNLNGAIGSTAFDAPRQLVITLASSAYNKRFKIIGKDEFGVAQTDVFASSIATKVAGRKIWSKIDSIQAIEAVAVAVTIGVTSSYAEIYNEVNTAKQYLLTHGFLRASDLYVCPGGETNALLLRVLRDLGYNYARITDNSINYPQLASFPYHINASGSGMASGDSATLKTYADNLISSQSIGGIYLHKIVEDSATPTSIDARISDFRALIDYLVNLRDAGSLKILKMRDVMSMTIGN